VSELDVDVDEADPRRGAARLAWLLVLLLLVLVGVAGYFGVRSWQSLRAHADTLEHAATDSEARLAQLQQLRDTLQRRVKTLEEEAQRLSTEGEALARQVQERDALLAKLEVTHRALGDKLKDEIQRGDILLSQAQGRLQVDLVDRVLFDSGQAELSARGRGVLTRVGAVLATVEDRVIQVSGHTDDSPPTERLASTYPTNWELSASRAVNVVRFLSEKAGVPPRRLVAAGHGPYRAVAANATPEGRARNRRIEILLTPAVEVPPVRTVKRPSRVPAARAAALSTPSRRVPSSE
jgi:chemotaxis protein MotB